MRLTYLYSVRIILALRLLTNLFTLALVECAGPPTQWRPQGPNLLTKIES